MVRHTSQTLTQTSVWTGSCATLSKTGFSFQPSCLQKQFYINDNLRITILWRACLLWGGNTFSRKMKCFISWNLLTPSQEPVAEGVPTASAQSAAGRSNAPLVPASTKMKTRAQRLKSFRLLYFQLSLGTEFSLWWHWLALDKLRTYFMTWLWWSFSWCWWTSGLFFFC